MKLQVNNVMHTSLVSKVQMIVSTHFQTFSFMTWEVCILFGTFYLFTVDLMTVKVLRLYSMTSR